MGQPTACPAPIAPPRHQRSRPARRVPYHRERGAGFVPWGFRFSTASMAIFGLFSLLGTFLRIVCADLTHIFFSLSPLVLHATPAHRILPTPPCLAPLHIAFL